MVENQITKMTLYYLITCKIDKSTQTEKLDIFLEKQFWKLQIFIWKQNEKVVTSQKRGIYNLTKKI
jgi:hypothetical protein